MASAFSTHWKNTLCAEMLKSFFLVFVIIGLINHIFYSFIILHLYITLKWLHCYVPLSFRLLLPLDSTRVCCITLRLRHSPPELFTATQEHAYNSIRHATVFFRSIPETFLHVSTIFKENPVKKTDKKLCSSINAWHFQSQWAISLNEHDVNLDQNNHAND